MKKNDIVTGRCESYTFDGNGVVKINGFPLFVKGLMLQEEAEIIVTMVKKTYGYGKLHKLITASNERIEPRCPIAAQCGGCQLQHMSYSHQKTFKKQQVEAVMRRIGGITTPVDDILGMCEPWHYRNKAQIPFGEDHGSLISGFYRIHSHSIIDTDQCLIQHPLMNDILKTVKSTLKENGGGADIRHLLIKLAASTNEAMVVFIVTKKQAFNHENMIAKLTTQFPQIKSILININTRNDNVILGEQEILLYGRPYIVDRLINNTYQIAMKSFYQVNPAQTEVLYQTACDFAQLTGKENVIDLYCGVGTISLTLAKYARKVTGIEIVPEAIENAKANAQRNQCNNVDFICADVNDYAKQLAAQQESVDVIVVDPPRKGCSISVLENIAEMHPQRIVYISCNPATQARDLKILAQHGYETVRIQPVDMFAQTYGIEVIALLTLRKS